MSAELTMDQLYDQYTSESQVKDATATPTVLTGAYRFKAQTVKPQVYTAEDVAKFPTDKKIIEGRAYARIFAVLFDRETGQRKGTVGFNVSWIPNYIKGDDGLERLDSSAKLWGQLLKATDSTARPVGEVLKLLGEGMQFDGFVEEGFKMPDGSIQKYRGETEEARKAARKALANGGGDPLNYVNNIFKPRA